METQEQQEQQEQRTKEEDETNRLYYENRLTSIKKLEDAGFTVYPHKFERTHTLMAVIVQYGGDKIDSGQHKADVEISVAGRIRAIRTSSSNLFFLDIVDSSGELQVLWNFKFYQNEKEFEILSKTLRPGDIIGVTGHPAKSRTGELSVLPKKLQLLSPCYHSLPAQNTLTDVETRHRNRHLDFIVNPKHKHPFIVRAKVIKFIRNFFDERGYLEVETPTLNILPGGANARPFRTYHNDLHADMFMRIAPELYLKQLIISGFDRVYEIGKNFRNEGVDHTHNPEYTAIETYCAYDDFEDVMKTTEELLSNLVLSVTGSYVIQYANHSIDFTPPFKRVPMIETLEKALEVTFPTDLASDETNQFLRDLLTKREVHCGEPRTTPRLLDKLVGEYIEPTLINPGFITLHPQIMSPLAKVHRSLPGLTERFELFVVGRELCNAYTELNNPATQRQNFTNEQKGRNAGDAEAQPVDEGFCTALEYGLPPTGGWGMGIDRLCMLLSNVPSIKDVILFPTMKPLEREREAQKLLCQ